MMRFVKISCMDMYKMRKLYESLMSQACHGLLFREGLILGAEYVDAAKASGDEYLTAVRKVLEYRGWVQEVDFKKDRVIVKGSAEAHKEDESESCHRLRGILQKVLEHHHGGRAKVSEIECESIGNKRCIFQYETGVI